MINHRSFMSKLVEKNMKLAHIKKFKSEDAADKYMQKRSEIENNPLNINFKKYKNNAMITDYKGMQLITFGDKNNCNYTILYIHGGGVC